MKLTKLITTAALALCLVAPMSTTSSYAGGTISLGYNAKTEKEKTAVRTGLFGYKLFKKKKGNGIVDQKGKGNSAGLAQKGSGHTGVVHQRGEGHKGTVNQCGKNNSFGLFQFGKNANGNVNQCGDGEAGAAVQVGF